MTLEERTGAFVDLGILIHDALSGSPATASSKRLGELITLQRLHNKWFTPVNVRMALEAVGKMLVREKMDQWLSSYTIPEINHTPVTVALVMAGNVPLVGFHDLMAVLVTGNRALVKTSSKDPELIREISGILTGLNTGFSDLIGFTDGYLKDYDAVIATGSDNSARYFEYNFGSNHHLFRKNRTSISIVDSGITPEEISSLGRDIFSYFGLGCRNISKIFIPRDFDLSRLIPVWQGYSHLNDHPSWKNNYIYNRAIFMVNGEQFTDGGFFLLKEDKKLVSPPSVVYYQHYDRAVDIEKIVSLHSGKIQCITGKGYIAFGDAQQPDPWDYADNVDTIKFLLSLKKQ